MPAINITSAPYDLTNVTQVDNILEFIQEINIITDLWFMSGMLIAGFIIMFVAMLQPSGPKDALMASSFMTAVLAIFFRTLEFIDNGRLIVIILVFTIIFVMTLMRKD